MVFFNNILVLVYNIFTMSLFGILYLVVDGVIIKIRCNL